MGFASRPWAPIAQAGFPLRRPRTWGHTRRTGFLIAASISAILSGGGLWMLSSPGKLLVPRLGSNLLSGLLSIALGLLLGLLCLLAAFRPRSARRKVAVVESFLRVRWASETNLSLPRGYYYETDAGLSFRVPERGTCLIDPGQRYRLYYAVGGQELVNLEPVGSTFSFRSPESVSALATPFSASPFHLSAAEVSAILGVPVTPEELNAQPHA